MVLLQRGISHTVQLRELREGLRDQCSESHETVCLDRRQSETGQVGVPSVWIVLPPEAHSEGLDSYLSSRETLSEQVPHLGVSVCVGALKGESKPVVWPRELQDEQTHLVPTYRPSVGPLPLGCSIDVRLHILTFQMYFDYLVPGPLPVIYPFCWLRQALMTRHSLFHSDDPSFGSSHYTLPQPHCYVVVGPDPCLLERRT
jgi:hypothetical protein